jgi:hypothetical protein
VKKLGPIKPVRGLRRMSGPLRYKSGMNERGFARALDRYAREEDRKAGLTPPPLAKRPKKPKK